jgi:hypothetical protein
MARLFKFAESDGKFTFTRKEWYKDYIETDVKGHSGMVLKGDPKDMPRRLARAAFENAIDDGIIVPATQQKEAA